MFLSGKSFFEKNIFCQKKLSEKKFWEKTIFVRKNSLKNNFCQEKKLRVGGNFLSEKNSLQKNCWKIKFVEIYFYWKEKICWKKIVMNFVADFVSHKSMLIFYSTYSKTWMSQSSSDVILELFPNGSLTGCQVI